MSKFYADSDQESFIRVTPLDTTVTADKTYYIVDIP